MLLPDEKLTLGVAAVLAHDPDYLAKMARDDLGAFAACIPDRRVDSHPPRPPTVQDEIVWAALIDVLSAATPGFLDGFAKSYPEEFARIMRIYAKHRGPVWAAGRQAEGEAHAARLQLYDALADFLCDGDPMDGQAIARSQLRDALDNCKRAEAAAAPEPFECGQEWPASSTAAIRDEAELVHFVEAERTKDPAFLDKLGLADPAEFHRVLAACVAHRGIVSFSKVNPADCLVPEPPTE